MIGKIWLRFAAPLISEARGQDEQRFHILWKGVLGAYVRVLRGPHSEGVAEQLKNVLLVMHSDGLTADAQDKLSEGAWKTAWATIEPVAPGLRKELFPQT